MNSGGISGYTGGGIHTGPGEVHRNEQLSPKGPSSPPNHAHVSLEPLTSVCTISGRLSLIFFKKLRGPTSPSQSSRRSRTSSAMKVPVRPTPALSKGQDRGQARRGEGSLEFLAEFIWFWTTQKVGHSTNRSLSGDCEAQRLIFLHVSAVFR